MAGESLLRESRLKGGTAGPPLHVALATLLLALILSTLLGNGLVCLAVLRFRHLRSKVTNAFVVSLAVSDLLVAVLVMPWKAVAAVAGFWPFGGFCNVWVAFDIMCSTASILHLCIISVDRYWAIASPFRYEQRMTHRVAFVMMGVAWALSVLISFIPVQLRWHKASQPLSAPQADSNGTWVAAGGCDASLNRTYAISSSLVSFYIPVAIMIVTYTRIFRIAQRQIRRISSLERAAGRAQSCQSRDCPHDASLKNSFRKETKVLKTLSVIMGAFVCCWLPFFVLNCIVPFCEPHLHQQGDLPCVSGVVFDVFVWFGWANSSINPIIYAFNADFRRAFAAVLGCGRLCPSSTTVETVNFSNELVSYHHDSTCQRDLALLSCPPLLPHAAALQGEENELAFDKVSQTSPSNGAGIFSATVYTACEADLSLEKMMPFASRALD